MTLGLNPYPDYKNSNVPWLGMIPGHWNLRKMKYIFRERSEKGFPDEPLLAATQTKGVVQKEEYENRTVMALKDLHLLKLVKVGDFVISLRSFQGGIEVAHHQGIISPAYTILTPSTSVYSDYYSKLFKSKPFIENLSLYVTGIRQGQNIDYSRLCRSFLPYPSIAEQEKLADFVNCLDLRINRLIRAKRRMIELLYKQMQAIVQRAVTRGVDRDVTMKPSGLEWLGEIPEHWETRPAKYYYREVDERSTSGNEELLSVSHITGVTPRSQKNITMFMASSYIGHKICRPGDLVINTMWAWMGALGVSDQVGIVSPSYAVYRPTSPNKINATYVDFLLRTRAYISEYICQSAGIRPSRLRLYPEKFLNIPMLLPNKDEQEIIVNTIKQETNQVDRIISNTKDEIRLLQEYRTRMIADMVTGKLDVRGVELPALDESYLVEEDEQLDESDIEDIDKLNDDIVNEQ